MKLSMLVEDSNFTYDNVIHDFWRDIIHTAIKEQHISFDLENNDDVEEKQIVIDQDFWDDKCKFNCCLCMAGGDWQSPVYYFKCQLINGFANLKPGVKHFCVIPPKDNGNVHLVRTKNGWSAPDSDCDQEPDKTMCWKYIKGYLKELVDNEIKNVKSGKS